MELGLDSLALRFYNTYLHLVESLRISEDAMSSLLHKVAGCLEDMSTVCSLIAVPCSRLRGPTLSRPEFFTPGGSDLGMKFQVK